MLGFGSIYINGKILDYMDQKFLAKFIIIMYHECAHYILRWINEDSSFQTPQSNFRFEQEQEEKKNLEKNVQKEELQVESGFLLQHFLLKSYNADIADNIEQRELFTSIKEWEKDSIFQEIPKAIADVTIDPYFSGFYWEKENHHYEFM